MSNIQTYVFDNPANFTGVDAVVDNTINRGLLDTETGSPLVDTQDFSNDTGFTYDPLKTEFAAGVMRQVDQRPANATFAATYTTNINGSWGNGSPTPLYTAGTPVITGNRLDLSGGTVQHVVYDAAGNAPNTQVGAAKWKVTPNYSGSPAANQHFFSLNDAGSSLNNHAQIVHRTSGQLRMVLRNSAGVNVALVDLGIWSPVSGTTYEMEFNFDATLGEHRLFVDGVQFGATVASAYTRNAALEIRIGTGATVAQNPDFFYEDLIIFSSVQHTANYTPGYTLSENIYSEDDISLPSISYAGVGDIDSITSLSVTEVGTPRYTINGLYWNGAAWVSSDGSYAQASSLATVNTTIGSFGGPLISVGVNVVFPEGSTLNSVDDLVVNYVGQQYKTFGYLEPSMAIDVSAIDSYADLSSTPTNTEIRLILRINNQLRWYNTVTLAWEDSDGTLAQSNTSAELNANLVSLVLGSNSTVYVRWLLSTTDVTATPTLTTSTINYDFGAVASPADVCTMFGYLRDMSNQPLAGIKCEFELDIPDKLYKEAASNVVSPQIVNAFTDANGYFEIDLIRSSEFETATDYKMTINFKRVSNQNNVVTESSIGTLVFTVPDANQQDITDLLPTP